MQPTEPTAPGTDIRPQDHVLGPVDAAATVVEYGDYACSWCAEAHVFVARARHQFGDALRFVYRHFPMQMMRDRALPAAEAAEAAGAQGRFWEMHDLLFAHQAELAHGCLVEYAGVLGLDTARFARELVCHTHAARVQADVASGAALGVNTTPTFVINGVRFDHAWSEASLLEAIGEAAASPSPDAGR